MQLKKVIENYQPFVGWRANFVVNLEGAYIDSNGSSKGVSSSEDRLVLIHLRKISDVVLVSAKSASLESLGSTKSSTLAIVAGSGPLPPIPALTQANEVLVLAPRNSDHKVTLDVTSTAKLVLLANEIKGRISPQELVTAIESLGYRSPISEFGPDWLRQLSKAEVLDEVFLTITKSSQQNFEEETPRLAIRGLLPESNYELALALEFGNNLFTRWVKK